jgi:hypothetical protein
MDKSKIPVAQRAALSLLLDEHRTVKKLFKSFEEASRRPEQEQLAKETCAALTRHAELEESTFYPALRGLSDTLDDMLDEAEVEHQVAKDLIAKIEANLGTDLLEAHYKVLSEYVSHHVEEEEEEMFKTIIQENIDLTEVVAEMKTWQEEAVTIA